MFGTIRKHSTWMWAIIIVVVVISFVIYFSPDARYHVLGRRSKSGYHVNNRPITGPEYEDALREAKLQFFFRYGTFPDRSDEMARQNFRAEEAANSRLLLAEMLRQMNIQVGIDATLRLRDELLTLATGGQTRDMAAALNAFEEQILRKNGFTLLDFERFLRHEAGLQHLVELCGVAGRLTTPQEAEAIFRREHEELDAALVYFSASNYLAAITNFPPEAISQLYSNRLAEYAIPERVELVYVHFPLTNYLSLALTNLTRQTNIAALVNSVYSRQPTNYWKDKDGNPLPEAEAKARIEKDLIEDQARRLAMRAVNEYTHGFNLDKTNSLQDFLALAARSNLTVHTAQPFDLLEGPKDLKLPERAVPILYRLQPEDPVLINPIPGEDGAYLFALKQRLPRQIPSLDAVRDKVIEDYKREQAMAMAKLRADIFYNTLTNGLAQGQNFTQICLDHGHLPIVLPPFSRVTGEVTNLPPGVSLNEVRNLVADLAPGNVTAIRESQHGYWVAYLRRRLPVDENKLKKELPVFLANLRERRQNEAANEWINRQYRNIPARLMEPSRSEDAAKGPRPKS
ncbi:MAG: peptidylprolyl isomerase [Verrucomicrobiae bacterium]|nr:peptidylprolyl isomerase [Verrucomicrobiae bacterium]